jgi:hypothetical protein
MCMLYVCHMQGWVGYYVNAICYSYMTNIVISNVTFALPKLSNVIWLLLNYFPLKRH